MKGDIMKKKIRTEQEKEKLNKRLNIILGQVNGIKQMINEDRYCGDILIQISSVSSSLKSLGNVILNNHIKSCVIENIEKGNLDIVDELIELSSKLNK